jgi:hypothetical protein
MQMCKLCTNIIIVQIINNENFHSINVYKHENEFEIVCIDIQSWKVNYEIFFFIFIEIQFDYKSKYIA